MFLSTITLLVVNILVHNGEGQTVNNSGFIPYNGWYNNLVHPDWGTPGSTLLRLVSPVYSDGVYLHARPNGPGPIDISETLHSGAQGQVSDTKTALAVFFGQQVVDEILDSRQAACIPEILNIPIPKNHSFAEDDIDDLNLPLRRARYDHTSGDSPSAPRKQVNMITSYLDGSSIYGVSKVWTDQIREFKYGRLAALSSGAIKRSLPRQNRNRVPFYNSASSKTGIFRPVDQFFGSGNRYGNENPFLLTLQIIWFRYHNYIASVVRDELQTDDDDVLFNEARKRVIAAYQNVVLYEWLPVFLGENVEKYNGYNPNIHPGISHVFSTAAMRFGHSLIPSSVYLRYGNCSGVPTGENSTALYLCNLYWDSEATVRANYEEMIMGLISTPAEKEDAIISDSVRKNLYGPREFSRRDLCALNIMRGRDHGVPDYNTVREAFGFAKFGNFSHAFDDQIAAKLRTVYSNIDEVDLYTGGLLESKGGNPGELFRKIIYDQFLRIRDGDRFWFENLQNRLFTKAEVEDIRRISFYDIILNVTNILPSQIQQNVFLKTGDPCPQYSRIETVNQNNCTPKRRFDYFKSSEVSFALTYLFIFLFLVGMIGLMLALVRHRKKSNQETKTNLASSFQLQPGNYLASEWIGPKKGKRAVIISFDKERHKVLVTSNKTVVRMLDLRSLLERVIIRRSNDNLQNLMCIRFPNESDLVLKFHTNEGMLHFLADFKEFCNEMKVKYQECENTEFSIKETANTKEARQDLISDVMAVVCLDVLGKSRGRTVTAQKRTEVLGIQITRSELAELFSLQPNSKFVRNMFLFADKSRRGTITLEEFTQLFIIFSKGDSDKKIKFLFDIYDIHKTGFLRKQDFQQLMRSMLELSQTSVDEDQLQSLISYMLQMIDYDENSGLDYENFKKIFDQHSHILDEAQLDNSGMKEIKGSFRKTIINIRGIDEVKSAPLTSSLRVSILPNSTTKQDTKLSALLNYIENQRMHIFWLVLYTLIAIGIFVERAYYYSVFREHGGLRRIAGYGVTFTRGAASGMMFTYSTLLVTMSRNVITALRETFINRYIPFDAYISFHKYVAFLALLFTIAHVVGFGFNMYHIATQTPEDLSCLFTEYYRASHVLISFHYWCFATISGITGVILTVIVIIIYVFAIQYSRQYLFKIFWLTHGLYPLLYIFLIMHGLGRLVQSPITHYYLLGPLVLFIVDRLMVFQRRRMYVAVYKAEMLPSDVIGLKFRKPANFDYRSGQWVRISCVEINKSEYHPFTISSAPHEEHLTLHIRAVGPWTKRLRHIYNPDYRYGRPLSHIYLDGPYGEGHQDWYTFDVSILVGGGIGVTPFASILKDIAFKSNTGAKIHCKKVYFLWVTRTQKHFEWLTDIIRQVEKSDAHNVVSVHVFITQFSHKFDLRTTMLYICERHFHRFSNKSLFTGLKSITHFGRPYFYDFLQSLAEEHRQVKRFGVFSCGPPPMTNNVEHACNKLNSYTGPSYIHHFENF